MCVCVLQRTPPPVLQPYAFSTLLIHKLAPLQITPQFVPTEHTTHSLRRPLPGKCSSRSAHYSFTSINYVHTACCLCLCVCVCVCMCVCVAVWLYMGQFVCIIYMNILYCTKQPYYFAIITPNLEMEYALLLHMTSLLWNKHLCSEMHLE